MNNNTATIAATEPVTAPIPARVFVMYVTDTQRPSEDPVWGVFTTAENALREVYALVGDSGGDFGRDEPVFLIQGTGMTWNGVQTTNTVGVMRYSGITVAIVGREVRP